MSPLPADGVPPSFSSSSMLPSAGDTLPPVISSKSLDANSNVDPRTSIYPTDRQVSAYLIDSLSRSRPPHRINDPSSRPPSRRNSGATADRLLPKDQSLSDDGSDSSTSGEPYSFQIVR